jgi:DnaK suppressor protein
VDPERAQGLLAGEREQVEREIAAIALDSEGLYQDEFDAGRVEGLKERLAAVERAERRLDAGTYGLSVRSGAPIPDERLEILPTAELTVEEEGGARPE